MNAAQESASLPIERMSLFDLFNEWQSELDALKATEESNPRWDWKPVQFHLERLHALARDLNYGKRGRLNRRDWLEQRNSCSALTLILACIIYWQAKEIHRVLLECDPEMDLDWSLVEHISPITWDNVILYGEYVIDRSLIQL